MPPAAASSTRLRVRLGTAVVPCGSDVVFTAGSWHRRIGGKDALRAVLPVARLLDGTRTVAELADAVNLDPGVVTAVVDRLSALGLLESAEQDVAGGLDATARAFLRKVPDVRSAAEHELLLSRSAVTVVARDSLTDRIARDLLACGVGTVLRAAGPSHQPDSPAHRVLMLVEDTGPRADATIGTSMASQAVLRFRIDEAAIEIGPSYPPGLLPAEQTCLACARAGRDRLWPAAGTDATGGTADATDEPAAYAADFGCGLVVAEVLALLAGVGPVTSGDRLTRVELADLRPVSYLVLPEPGCPRCDPADSAAEPLDDLAEAYETAQHVTRGPFGECGLPAVSQRKVAAYQSFRSIYPSSPSIELPPAGPADDDTPADGGAEQALADLLRLAAGRRHPGSGDTARWAWSAYNLGSAELFLIGQRQVFGMPAGSVLKYDDLRHALIVAHDRVIDAGKLFAANGAADMDFVIAVTGAFGRLGDVCGEQAFRLGYLDAGYALAQLSVAAASLRLATRTSSTWTGGLPDALELTAGREAVTAVAWIANASEPTKRRG
jgi:hypothetical protein